MIRRRSRGARPDAVADPAAGAPSPWAGDVDVPERAPIDWAMPAGSAGDVPGPDVARPDHDPPLPAPRSRWRTAAAGAAAVAVLGLVAVAVTSGDDGRGAAPDDEAAAAELEPPPTTTLVTLPPADATPPPADEADETEQADEGASSLDDGGVASGSTGGAGDGDPADVTRTSPPTISTLQLPDGLPAFAEPFELVLTTDDGLATVSFPSGTIRTIDLAGSSQVVGDYEQLVVGPDASLITNSRGVLIVPRSGIPTQVDVVSPGITPIGWQQIDGRTGFTLVDWSGPDEALVLELTADGELIERGRSPGFLSFATSEGGRIFGDGGGVFLDERDGGTTRLIDGLLLGFANGHALVRRCDENYVCAASTIEVATGRRTDFAPGSEAELAALYHWDSTAPSPDGSMVAIVAPDETGAPIDVLVGTDGASSTIRHDARGLAFNGERVAWAPDSSGFFRTLPRFRRGEGPTLVFVTRAGDVIEIGDLPEGVTSAGVRSVGTEAAATDRLDDPDTATIADADFELVGLQGARAVHVDPTSGRLASWPVPDLGDRPDLGFVDGALIAISADGTTAFRSRFGTVVDERDASAQPIPGPRYAASNDRLTWRPNADRTRFELVPITFHDSAGRTPWRVIDVAPDAVLGTNGAGELVWVAGGDVFASGGSETRIVTTDELVALGPTAALVRRCDGGGCGNSLVASDATSTPLAGPPGAADPVVAPVERPIDGTISPDGEVVFASLDPRFTDDGSPHSGAGQAFLDLGATRVTPAPAPDPGTTVLWSPDGRHAVIVAGGTIHVYSRADGSLTELLDAGVFDAVTMVPIDFDD